MEQEKSRYQMDSYWRGRIFGICLLLAGITFIAEIIYCTAGYLGLIDVTEIKIFMIRYILMPTIINFTGILFTKEVLTSKHFSEREKNRVVCYLAFLLTAVIECTHYSYAETALLPCIVIMFAALVVDEKLCRNICVVSYVVLLIACMERYLEGVEVGYRAFVGFGIAAAGIYASYRVSILLAQHELTQFWLISRSRKQKTALMEQIRIEPTTGLLSRRILMDTLDQRCKENEAKEMYLAMVDVDNFKKINDTYGHICGDEVLRRIGKIIKEHVKESGEGFRYGGEEFVILFAQSTMDDVICVMEKIRKSMAKAAFDFLDQGRVTISCGIAEYHHGMKASDWIRSADELLYQAKHDGKNRVISELEQAG